MKDASRNSIYSFRITNLQKFWISNTNTKYILRTLIRDLISLSPNVYVLEWV